MKMNLEMEKVKSRCRGLKETLNVVEVVLYI